MTVKELKELIEDSPDNFLVLARGYEGGYDEVVRVQHTKAYRQTHADWYDGEYLIDPDRKWDECKIKVDSLILHNKDRR